MGMQSEKLTYTIRAFLRREYFEPDVLRAALATTGLLIPLIVAHILGVPALGSFAAITAQLILAAKIQTTYPRKALIIFASLIFISLCSLIGTITGASFWLTVICMAIIAGISSLAKELGSHGQTLSLCGVILFLISLSGPHHLETGIERLLSVWLGGVWAAFLLLFPWPFRPHLPYFTNLATPWELGSNLADLLAQPPSEDSVLEDQGQKKEIALRTAINNVLPFLRKNDQQFFFIRRDLLKIVRASSRFGATMLAMFPNLENLRQQNQNESWFIDLQNCFIKAADAAKTVANMLVLGRKKDLSQLNANILAFQQAISILEEHTNATETVLHVKLDLHRLIILFQSALHYLQDAHLLLNRIDDKKKLQLAAPKTDHQASLKKILSIHLLFDFRKVPLKHTLRLMLLTAFSVILFYWFSIPRGYWIALTIMVVLQPDYGTTQQKALQRVTGTSIGAVLSTLLLIHPFPPEYYVVAIAVFSFFFMYLLQRNYTVAVVFVTMMLVAMFEISGPVDWHIAAYRLFATCIGGLMAVVGAFLLWPDWERSQVRSIMAKGLLANQSLLVQLQHELMAHTGFHARIIADRRKAEIANLAIADSIVRLQLEPGTKKEKLQIAQSISFHNNRLTRELTSLAALLPSVSAEDSYPEAVSVLDQYARLLSALAESIKTEDSFTVAIPTELPFIAIASMLQRPPVHLFADTKNHLQIDTDSLKEELVHEQINKIAGTIHNLGKAIQAINKI